MRVLIIGATSGIGRELAKCYALNNDNVAVAGRRVELLVDLSKEINKTFIIKKMDIADVIQAKLAFNEIINELGGLDLFILSSGTGHINPEFDWSLDKDTIDVNVIGTTYLLNEAMKYLIKQGKGHIVGISSIAAIRGSREGATYNASKAYLSNYLEGLRHLAVHRKTDIVVTDIQPGLVDTAMAKGEGLFWVAKKEVAARAIFKAIKRKKSHAYITKRWRIIALILKILPKWIYYKL